jgi:hypothetical protein
VTASLTDRCIAPEQDAEHKDMRHEQKRDKQRRNEVRRALQSGSDPDSQTVGLIKRVEQITGADHVEHPDCRGPEPIAQARDRQQRQNAVVKSP